MRSIFLGCIINCILLYSLSAQPLAAYVDIQNQLMVWDNGNTSKIDFMPPTSMKIGRTCIPYLDNSRSFKIYYNGAVQSLNIGFTNAYFVTDNLVAYLNQKSLNVFDRGTNKNLASICDQYFVADSLVVFLDGQRGEYRAYYDGKTYAIETFIPDSTLARLKMGSNIVAFDNFASLFRIFYQGQLIAQEDYPVNGFGAGRNTVAYVDVDHKFKIFHSGQTYVIDDYAPGSFKVGDDLVAFVSGDGYFKVFYGDSIHTIGFFSPTYQVKDNVLAYKDPSGSFKIFFKGKITDMETYYPTKYEIQYNSVAYMNTSNTLRLFTEGEAWDVTNADLTHWKLDYDVITYQIGQGIFRIFYKGTEY